MKQLFLKATLAALIGGSLALSGAGAAEQGVSEEGAALAQVATPADVDAAESSLRSTAGAMPYAPESQGAESSISEPAAALPEDLPLLPPMVSSPPAMAWQPISSSISVAQMGQHHGVTLSGGQLQSGIMFTLPGDQVVTNAHLDLSLRVSPGTGGTQYLNAADAERAAAGNLTAERL